MSRIAVVHPRVNNFGGAEAVCVNILEALGRLYEVDLITISSPDIEALESFYDCELKINQVHSGGTVERISNMITPAVSALADGGRLDIIDSALINIFARRKLDSYDLVISTNSEMHFNSKSVQYIHYPMFNVRKLNRVSKKYSFLETICEKAVTINSKSSSNTTYIANSSWTSRQFEKCYNTSPQVVYPPADCQGNNKYPWEDREDGFVVVGRISPEKNIMEIANVIKSLRSDGFDTHLHIVGPPSETNYLRKIKSLANKADCIHFEGKVEQKTLVDLMSKHKYAIHGKKEEHFGIVVAEFISAGTIPFVHGSGGQVEIVNQNSSLLYNDWQDLRSKITELVYDKAKQQRILQELPDAETEFGRARFKSEVIETIENILEADTNCP